MSGVKRVALGVAVLLFAAPAGRADLFTGTLYFTHFGGGGPNVLNLVVHPSSRHIVRTSADGGASWPHSLRSVN
jgi:hypothetical protein